MTQPNTDPITAAARAAANEIDELSKSAAVIEKHMRGLAMSPNDNIERPRRDFNSVGHSKLPPNPTLKEVAKWLRNKAIWEQLQPYGRDMDAREWAATCMTSCAEELEGLNTDPIKSAARVYDPAEWLRNIPAQDATPNTWDKLFEMAKLKRELADSHATVRRLEGECERLRKAMTTHAEHRLGCRVFTSQVCSCGLDAAMQPSAPKVDPETTP